MPYKRDAAAVVSDWREVLRDIERAKPGSSEAERLAAEADRLQAEYVRLGAEAFRKGETLPPPDLK